LIAVAGLMFLSINLNDRFAQAQSATTATPRSTSTPIVEGPTTGVPVTYTIKSGDSFNAIARQFNLTPQQLQALNAITNTGVIRVGQVLIVGVSTFTPAPSPTDTPASTATTVPAEPPTVLPTETSTREPVREPTATTAPTLAPTNEPLPTDRPVATSVPVAIEPPAVASAPAPASVPIDVILVGAMMVLAVIGIIIGFRTQRG
jgi:LysM repeat protein